MDRWTVLARAAAVSSAGAAAIHFGVTQQHFGEWWPAGVFFVVCGGWQAAWAVLAWSRPSNGLLVTGAVGNAAVALLWLVTRTIGLPFGPGAGDVEAIGVTDVVCTALEAAVIVLAGVLLALRPSDVPPASPGRAVTVATAGVAAVVLLTSGVALAAPQEQHHDDEEQQHGHERAKAHKEPNLPDVSKASKEDTEKARQLLADSIATTKGYRDTDTAEDAGYDVASALKRWQRRHPKADELTPLRALHVGRRANRTDGKVADPSAPETLIYRRDTDGKLALVGVMYVVDREDGEPPAVAGPYTRWHTHQRRQSPSMMHVWFVQDDRLRQAYARKPPAKAIEEYQRTLS